MPQVPLPPPTRVVRSLMTEGVAVYEVWPYVLAIFISGGVLTAAGLTILSSSTAVLVGMILTSIGIVGMWLPGRGAIRRMQGFVIFAFLSGNLATALSLTTTSSSELLLIGMILSAAGISGMWLMGQVGSMARVISAVFILGISLQAVGMTVQHSATLVGLGMIFVSAGIFGMWLHGHPFRFVRDYERDEAVAHAVEAAQKSAEIQGH